MAQKRVLLVDHNDDFLDGLREWLVGLADLDIVGAVQSGREAIDEIDRLDPDLVLVDTTLPDLNGFEVIRRIKNRPDAPLVALMTFHDSHAVRLEAEAVGADSCLLKSRTDRLLPEISALLDQLIESGDGNE